jgi:hypothetical protein
MTSTTTTQTPETSARGIVRDTFKGHGRPTALEFFGTAVKAPAEKGLVAHKIVVADNQVTLKARNGRVLEGGQFGVATKFWAIVPEEARTPEPVKQTGPKAPALPPVKITAAKGGDQTVTPIKGAIAKAITATGRSIMAISREHGLNPSQMRRLSLDTVAKVDLVRAELIAKALGVKLADLFGEPTAKAKAATPPPATTGPKGNSSKGGSKSKATKAAEKTAADQAAREAAEAAEAKAAQDAAEGTQAEPTTDPEGTTPEGTTETPAAE